MKWAILAWCWLACSAFASQAKLETVKVGADLATLERGAETVTILCVGCHSLKYIKYFDLAQLGIAQDKIDAWRGTQPLNAVLAAQMPAAVAAQSFGAVPPDLSLIAKAREGGADYVYSFLLGFYSGPQGMPDNHVFPATKMPDILGASAADSPAQRAEVQNKARDVVSFLVWAADPHAAQRHALGKYVIGYLLLLTLMLYLMKNRIWGRLG